MYIRFQLMLLDVPKDVYIFDIIGETDYGIEQRPIFRNIGLQHNTELFDINNVAILIFLFIVFYKETVAVVNLKVRQCIKSDVTETGIIYKPFVFMFKAMLDIFYISNSPLVYLNKFVLIF